MATTSNGSRGRPGVLERIEAYDAAIRAHSFDKQALEARRAKKVRRVIGSLPVEVRTFLALFMSLGATNERRAALVNIKDDDLRTLARVAVRLDSKPGWQGMVWAALH